MKSFKGKKLLILGGAFQHCKLVEAAKEMGVITYVSDYLPLEKAPAKQVADYYAMHNITAIDELVEYCKKEGIDGVISTSLDACQKPYQILCERLGFPCFGTKEQFDILTDKNLFKQFCIKNGVDVIPAYSIEDFADKKTCEQKVSFPILIKPGESRGSRGQTICYSWEETENAIKFAIDESSNGRIVIEKYMGQANDFSMTILMINGKAYPFRTVDRYLGKYEDGLDKLAVGSLSPSRFTDVYMTKVNEKVEKLYQDMGLVNAPVFMQGFVDGDTVRFYDPGLRLPGGEYERLFTAVCGKNPIYPLIEFALSGEVKDYANIIDESDIWLKGKAVGQILPALRPGKITQIIGMEKIRSLKSVIKVFDKGMIGDEVKPTKNVNQRFCEIDVVCDSKEDMKKVVDLIYDTLKVLDENGEDMIVSKYDTTVLVN